MTGPPRPPLRVQWLGTVPYDAAWEMQRGVAAARRHGQLGDCVLMLEHPPVYTLGRNTEARHLPAGAEALRALGAEVCEVDRGGSVTFHGPGQLVAYPIVRLADSLPLTGHPGHGDVVRYLRALEEALCATAAVHGVRARPRPPHTGAWVGEDKLGAIGVKLAGGVTTHGVALNVTTDLGWFSHVIPCGIDGAGVTSLAACGAAGVTPQSVAPALARALADAIGLRLVGDGADEAAAPIARMPSGLPR